MSPTSCQTAPPRVRFGEEADYDILFFTSQHIVQNLPVATFPFDRQCEAGANTSKLGDMPSTLAAAK